MPFALWAMTFSVVLPAVELPKRESRGRVPSVSALESRKEMTVLTRQLEVS